MPSRGFPGQSRYFLFARCAMSSLPFALPPSMRGPRRKGDGGRTLRRCRADRDAVAPSGRPAGREIDVDTGDDTVAREPAGPWIAAPGKKIYLNQITFI